MPARGERRRASAGNTHEPFDCCGKEAGAYGRPKGKICNDCWALIEEGKVARAKAAERAEAGLVAVYGWTTADYGWPRFYGADARFPHSSPADDELVAAFYGLVNALVQPAPADTPRHSPNYEMRTSSWDRTKKERHHHPWPMVLDEKGEWQFSQLVLMNPAARDAVNRLHQAILAALGAVYNHGKTLGGSVLQQLACGELSMADFDESLLTAEQRAERQKARRGY